MSRDKADDDNKSSQGIDKQSTKEFVWKTIAMLAFTIVVIVLLNWLLYNYGEIFLAAKYDQIGELGGVLQGTIGVAAALAGALVAIKLASNSVKLSENQNKIAERQARNDDPDFQLARETRNTITKIIFNHYVVLSDLRENKENKEQISIVGKKHADQIISLISSPEILIFLMSTSENEDSDSVYKNYNNNVVPLKKLVDIFNNNQLESISCEENSEYLNDYLKCSKNFFVTLEKAIIEIKNNNTNNFSMYVNELFTASFVKKVYEAKRRGEQFDQHLESSLKLFLDTQGKEFNAKDRLFCINTSLGDTEILSNVEAIVQKNIGTKFNVTFKIELIWYILQELYTKPGPFVLIINFNQKGKHNYLKQNIDGFYTRLRDNFYSNDTLKRNFHDKQELIDRIELLKTAGLIDKTIELQDQIVKYERDRRLAPSAFFEEYKSQLIQPFDKRLNEQMSFLEFIHEIDLLVKFDSNYISSYISSNITSESFPLPANYFYPSISKRIFVIAINYIDEGVGATEEENDWILDMFFNPDCNGY